MLNILFSLLSVTLGVLQIQLAYLAVSIISFLFLRAVPMVYGNSQAGGSVRAAAAGLHHSPSNTGSEPGLRPTPQLLATPDP